MIPPNFRRLEVVPRPKAPNYDGHSSGHPSITQCDAYELPEIQNNRWSHEFYNKNPQGASPNLQAHQYK
jgi:hypothetical protein